ncbi:MAG TPA: sulfate ABC transporter substrate-binding protein, partial [Nitrospira sp.]|nr:sulfate ABC transporter substrate-binding protein [Nitrospira sp.]
IAVIDRNADRHHVRDLADAFVSFLNGEEAQQAFVEFGFRPANEAVARASASAFLHPPHVFTIEDLGGWDRVFAAQFSPQGAWTKAVEETR